MPVHLFGLPAEMEKINQIARAHRLPVIEDAAQSIGARYHDQYVGSIGACGCFSFFPSKNLGGAGDGGMITTSDPELAERISVLRDHGSRKKYHYDLLGMNSRLDSLQAAILLVKFKHLDAFSEARRRNAGICSRPLLTWAITQATSRNRRKPASMCWPCPCSRR
jgi:dTDP-4-amino-4,6-dideoxygalactose transaminase